MKNKEDEPREYYERNILLIMIVTASGLLLDWLSIKLLADVNPWGTATAIPGIILTFQALWLIVNPYATVYEDRFEIKQSFFYSKEFFFLDAKAFENTKAGVYMVYNDDDREAIPLRGIRGSNKSAFLNKLNEKLAQSLTSRNF